MEKIRNGKSTGENIWTGYLKQFWQNRLFMGILLLTAVCAYGYKITSITIGIDDTPSQYYFEEGLIAIVGRWVLFLLNKVVSLAEFAPFVTDFAAVVLLVLAAMVWTVLFYSIFGEKIPMTGYAFFAAIFLSSPLISEVFTYFLHNGIAMGYLCCGISLCCVRQWQCGTAGLRKGAGFPREFWGVVVKNIFPAAVFLWIAMGCYESFMILWLAGLMLLLLSERISREKQGVWRTLIIGAVTALSAVVLRSLMIITVTKVFHLEYLQGEAVQRSITEMLGWMLQPGAFSELAMILKRTFVLYGVFGYAYLPIRVFVLSAIVIAAVALWKAIRGKDLWALVLWPAAYLAAFSLLVIEGKATLYRSAQFLPVFCGYGALLFAYAIAGLTTAWEKRTGHRWIQKTASLVRGAAVLILAAVTWNQCMDMTKWFYVDEKKYEAAVETVNRVALDLEKNFDTSKPVVFTGNYEIPYSIIRDAYVEYGTETYFKMKRLTDLIDPDLLDKYNRSYGVWVAQTPALSVIDWGRYAFDNDEELVKFFAMHGHELVALRDGSLYAQAEEESLELPQYPREGYIVDKGEYIIVHF